MKRLYFFSLIFSDTLFGMSHPVQVLADLTLENNHGSIQIRNNKEGDLVIDFPNEDALFDLQSIHWSSTSSWKILSRLNQAFYQNQQTVKVNVKGSNWATLGKASLPQFKYGKVVTRYVSRTPSVKISIYALLAALGASLLYVFFRRRN